MQIFSKILSNIHLCGVYVSFSGDMTPSNIDGFQRFNNHIPSFSNFEKIASPISKIQFQESSKQTNAGLVFTQEVTFQFSGSDAFQAQRIEMFHLIKYLGLELNNGKRLVIGRNDYFQNAKPNIEVANNAQGLVIALSSRSIMASGFVPTPKFYPYLIPVNF